MRQSCHDGADGSQVFHLFPYYICATIQAACRFVGNGDGLVALFVFIVGTPKKVGSTFQYSDAKHLHECRIGYQTAYPNHLFPIYVDISFFPKFDAACYLYFGKIFAKDGQQVACIGVVAVIVDGAVFVEKVEPVGSLVMLVIRHLVAYPHGGKGEADKAYCQADNAD